ncbi:MAG TPA: pyridoxamine 5'-phosphate oxidase family protein [Kribbella sp.]
MTRHASGSETVAPSAPETQTGTLTSADCWRLLGQARLGRLVYTDKGLPAVTVNDYVLDGDSLLFTTRDGEKLRAAERGDIVAFAIDSGAARGRSAWSLTVLGHLAMVPPERVDSLSVQPWYPGATATPLILRLRVESLTGQNVSLW